MLLRWKRTSVRSDNFMGSRLMTPAEAAALHANASANDGYVMWFVTLSNPANPGQAVAWAKKATYSGGERLPGELVADTLDELRTMLPAGLTWHDRTPFDLPDTVEVWELYAGTDPGRRNDRCDPCRRSVGSVWTLPTAHNSRRCGVYESHSPHRFTETNTGRTVL